MQLVRHKNTVDKCEHGDPSVLTKECVDLQQISWARGMGLPLSLHVLLISDRVPEVDFYLEES